MHVTTGKVANPEMGDGEMPAEVIYDQGGNVDIRVSWGGEGQGMIQIVTLAPQRESAGDPTDRLFSIVNEWLELAGMPQVDVAELRKRSVAEPRFDGWHATLTNWSEVNRLIRVLQRARDRQFGAPA